ncbi:MAG: type II toxin-antitoxin system VapC family toxin [Deltaproteobacteria bacterium]|nr:type II toxin-antitoxin system VapC family toxin [Deltaproteobacteria bacterium]
MQTVIDASALLKAYFPEIQQKIVNLDIERYDLNFFKTHLLDACKRFNISVYDASYLVLANKLKISLITGDRKFSDAVKVESKNVIWIGDFQFKRQNSWVLG